MCRLRLLGGFALEGQIHPLTQRRAEAVLAVLSVCGDLGCTRDRLLALLWPECETVHARHGLRDALHSIRAAIGPDAVPSGQQLLCLNPAVIGSDLRTFESARRAGQHAVAIQEYGGPFLDGFHVSDALEFERWLDQERTRLAQEYEDAVKHMAPAAERSGSWQEAADWWARVVHHDPLNTPLLLRYLEALEAVGDRGNALMLLERHLLRLREDLDLEPSPELLAKVERIRRA